MVHYANVAYISIPFTCPKRSFSFAINRNDVPGTSDLTLFWADPIEHQVADDPSIMHVYWHVFSLFDLLAFLCLRGTANSAIPAEHCRACEDEREQKQPTSIFDNKRNEHTTGSCCLAP